MDKEPDFINEQGVKWWLHESLTRYAGKSLRTLPRLDEALVYITELPDGYKTYVLVTHGAVIDESQQLEGIACKIDALRLSQQ